MSDHATTLRELAADMASNLATYPKGSEGVPALAREMAQIDSERAACLAGADALRRGTCGTCRFWSQTWPGINPTRGQCENHQAPACGSETVADDGCIKGYAPTEPTR